jgi:hypothetical protein
MVGLLFVAIFVGLAGCASPRSGAEAAPRILAALPGLPVEAYDVSERDFPIPDFGGSAPTLIEPFYDLSPRPFKRVNHFAPLMDSIQDKVKTSEPWESAGGRAAVACDDKAGILTVRQTPEGQAKVKELLAENRSRKLQTPQVNIECRFIGTVNLEETKRLSLWLINRTDPERQKNGAELDWRHLTTDHPLNAGGLNFDGLILDRDETAALLKEVSESQSATVLFAPKINMWNGQSAWIMDGVMSGIMLPRCDKPGRPLEKAFLNTGTWIVFKPTVSADRREVKLDLQPRLFEPSEDIYKVVGDALRASNGKEGAKWPIIGGTLTMDSYSGSVPDGKTILIRVALTSARLVGMQKGQETALAPVWEPLDEKGQGQGQGKEMKYYSPAVPKVDTAEAFVWVLVTPKIIAPEVQEGASPANGLSNTSPSQKK